MPIPPGAYWQPGEIILSTTPPIEDYALIGDCRSAALVNRAGGIDWLCWPRFDSGAVFAALLGTAAHGTWRIAPAGDVIAVRRRYLPATMVLETEVETATGRVALIDFMPMGTDHPAVIRIVEGRAGQVDMRMGLILRFDYGAAIPWVSRLADGRLRAIAGPDMVVLHATVPVRGSDMTTIAAFTLRAGESQTFSLSYGPSHLPVPPAPDIQAARAATQAYWADWAAEGSYRGPYADAVQRSVLTLKALTYTPTGGIVAAPTTSLPELPGGTRNWDYRYCWLRDASFTLTALLQAGLRDEAAAWQAWLHRAVAGSPDQVRPLYGLAGERRLPEWEVPWLPGYQGASPVRIGNGAAGQFQLDIPGEVLDALYRAGQAGLAPAEPGHGLQTALTEHLANVWQLPDDGIWEVRGGRRQFTHSKVMAWVGIDRAIRGAEDGGCAAPLPAWRELRARIHADICANGFNPARGSFVQTYGGTALDASLLLLPLVGFLSPDDPRIIGTVAAIERELLIDGLVLRYRDDAAPDGLPPGEGAFLLCSFWLADNYILQGRMAEARALFEHLLALRNDVGLMAEEYDPRARRMLGNFPQAFSHVGLINTALRLNAREC